MSEEKTKKMKLFFCGVIVILVFIILMAILVESNLKEKKVGTISPLRFINSDGSSVD